MNKSSGHKSGTFFMIFVPLCAPDFSKKQIVCPIDLFCFFLKILEDSFSFFIKLCPQPVPQKGVFMERPRTYQAAYVAMSRAKIPNASAASKLLLDAFLIGHNKVTAEAYSKAKIKGFKNFTEWRAFMCSKNWLCFELVDEKYPQYSPGSRLAKYINSEKLATKTVATLDETNALAVRMQQAEDEIKLLKSAVQSIIETYDPPFTKEKEAKHLKIVTTTRM